MGGLLFVTLKVTIIKDVQVSAGQKQRHWQDEVGDKRQIDTVFTVFDYQVYVSLNQIRN